MIYEGEDVEAGGFDLRLQQSSVLVNGLEVFRVIWVVDGLVFNFIPHRAPSVVRFRRRFSFFLYLWILRLWFSLYQFLVYSQSKNSRFVWVSGAVPSKPYLSIFITNRVAGLVI